MSVQTFFIDFDQITKKVNINEHNLNNANYIKNEFFHNQPNKPFFNSQFNQANFRQNLISILKEKFSFNQKLLNTNDANIDFEIKDKDYNVNIQLESFEQISNGTKIYAKIKSKIEGNVGREIQTEIINLKRKLWELENKYATLTPNINASNRVDYNNPTEIHNLKPQEHITSTINSQTLAYPSQTSTNSAVVVPEQQQQHHHQQYMAQLNQQAYYQQISQHQLYSTGLRARCRQKFDQNDIIICLRNVPFQTTRTQIFTAFPTIVLQIDKIYIARNIDNRDTGLVFLHMESQEQAKKILKLNNIMLNEAQIEICQVDSTYANTNFVKEIQYIRNEVAGMYEQDGKDPWIEANIVRRVPYSYDSYVAHLRGLPFDANEDAVERFLDVELVAIHFPRDNFGRPVGDAFVELGTEKDLNKAIESNRKNLKGTPSNRQIDVIRSSLSDLVQAMQASDTTGPSLVRGKEQCLRMNGLPNNVTDEQILAFFQLVCVSPTKIHRKNLSGQAFCEFASPQDCDLAMIRNKGYIGRRYIDLARVDYNYMAIHVGLNANMNMNSNINMNINNPNNNQQVQQQQNYQPQQNPQPMFSNPHIQENGIAYNYNAHMQKQENALTQQQQQQMQSHQFSNSNTDINAPFLVKMRGLPQSASTSDVENFLNGTNYIADTIRISIGEDGRPDGLAYVSYPNEREATMAISHLHKQYMNNRYIDMIPIGASK